MNCSSSEKHVPDRRSGWIDRVQDSLNAHGKSIYTVFFKPNAFFFETEALKPNAYTRQFSDSFVGSQLGLHTVYCLDYPVYEL
jgi:hypothetical protein